MKKIIVFFLIIFISFSIYSLDLDFIIEKAEKGDAEYQIILGIYYYRGENVEKDHIKAFQWFMKAAKQNEPEAQYYIGSMYRYGDGVNKNLKMSVEWLQKAADQNYPGAQYMLAGMYFIGLGVEKSNIMAYYYYKLASYNKIKEADSLVKELKELMNQTEINRAESLYNKWLNQKDVESQKN